MEKITKFMPAWDKRINENGENYGVHGVDIYMQLKGELGAVDFILNTNWHLPNVENEQLIRHANKPTNKIGLQCSFLPNPTLVGYHSPNPMYEGQQIACNECKLLDGKPCYSGESYCYATDVYNELVKNGSDRVWELLEEYYIEIFEELK